MTRAISFYAADGGTQIVGADSLGDIIAGATDTPVKCSVRNDGTEAFPSTITIGTVGTSDGGSQLRIGADSGTLSPPWGLGASVSSPGAGGVWGATGEYGVVVTALNSTGETTQSLEVTASVSVVTQKVTWSWTAVPGASGYSVYRRDPSATSYTSPSLIAANTVGTSLVDDGTAPATGFPPAANTTGGLSPDYGTPPSLSTGPLAFTALEPGQTYFFWVGRVVPTGTDATLNTRFGALDFS
jgi:hypothetical protein